MPTDVLVEPAAPARDGWAAFWRGSLVSVPINLAVFPFGVLYGAVAAQNGLGIFDATLMSATIFGGASQMVGLNLFGQHIAPWLVVLSILAVNFRHVLYSAALGRLVRPWSAWEKAAGFFFLTDPQFAQAEREHDAKGRVSFLWYLGLGVAIYLPWIAESALGAWLGNLLPNTHSSGIDFLLPIYFLGILMDFRGRPLWLPVVAVSAAASIAAFRFIGSPWHVSVGALAGIVVAALWPSKAEARP